MLVGRWWEGEGREGAEDAFMISLPLCGCVCVRVRACVCCMCLCVCFLREVM